MTDGPMGGTCPVCGRYWNARGCKPGDCKSTPEPMPISADSFTLRLADGVPIVSFAGVALADFCATDQERIKNMAREGKVGIAGMCASCSAKVEAATPVGAVPQVEHPSPWRWDGHDLRDANGALLINDCWTKGKRATPRVRALTELAPDLEQFARDCANGDAGPEDRIAERARELLARIDERSKGG